MDWKEFFKPTLSKIVISILLIILAIYSVGSVNPSRLCNCLIGEPCPCPQPFPYGNLFFQGIYYILFFADYTQSPWIGTASGPVYNFMDVSMLILNLLYIYILSCLIITISKKIIKKVQYKKLNP